MLPACEFLGGKLAALFGLNEPKYQYAIDEYYQAQKQVNVGQGAKPEGVLFALRMVGFVSLLVYFMSVSVILHAKYRENGSQRP